MKESPSARKLRFAGTARELCFDYDTNRSIDKKNDVVILESEYEEHLEP